MPNGRSKVGRALRERTKYTENEEYKKKKLKMSSRYRKQNRIKVNETRRIWVVKMNKFVNKKCIKCGKLLHFETKGKFCRKHYKKIK